MESARSSATKPACAAVVLAGRVSGMSYVASRRLGSAMLLALSVSGIARADAPAPIPGPSDVMREAEQVRLGRRARAARRWAEAEAAFEAALESAVTRKSMTEGQRAEVVGELGLCELE
jgi:hypothetical protein